MKVIIILVVVVVLIVLIVKRNKSVNNIVPTSPLPDTNQSLPASNMLDIDNFYDLEKDKTTYSEVKDIFTERGVSFSERTDLDGKPFLVFRLNALGIDWDGKVEFKDGKVWYYNLCTYRKDTALKNKKKEIFFKKEIITIFAYDKPGPCLGPCPHWSVPYACHFKD